VYIFWLVYHVTVHVTHLIYLYLSPRFFYMKVEDMLTKEKLDDFLTTVCYPHILTTEYEGSIILEDDGLHSKL